MPSLHTGFAQDLFSQWAADENNTYELLNLAHSYLHQRHFYRQVQTEFDCQKAHGEYKDRIHIFRGTVISCSTTHPLEMEESTLGRTRIDRI